jgi:hypothetical protein
MLQCLQIAILPNSAANSGHDFCEFISPSVRLLTLRKAFKATSSATAFAHESSWFILLHLTFDIEAVAILIAEKRRAISVSFIV